MQDMYVLYVSICGIMRLAIIDIGYNAIRAVVYERESIGAPEIFNDKFKSDILSLLEMHDLNVKHQTYLSLEYLIHIFNKLSVTNIKCVATAVLRGHPRANEFKDIVRERFNIEIDIISGEREAYLTAAGLLSGISNAQGLAADLGGGSLELASIVNKEVGSLKSLPLGTKVVCTNNLDNLNVITDIIRNEFGEPKCPNLYLIGGAFRLIGRFYMEFVRYPLKNLHNLEITRTDFEIYLEKLDRINKIRPFYQDKRIDFNAILVAKAMLEVFGSERIIVSNYGLKEGVRFVALPRDEQKKDIVYERVKTLVKFDENLCKFDEYIAVIEHLLIAPDTTTFEVITLGIILAHFNKNIDRTLRASFVVEFILSSDIPFSHRLRIMLALSLSCAYTTRSDLYINKLAKKMIGKQDYANSQIIGNFIKITREVDGPEFRAPSFKLILKDKYIEISTNAMLPKVIFHKVCERIKEIAFARRNCV